MNCVRQYTSATRMSVLVSSESDVTSLKSEVRSLSSLMPFTAMEMRSSDQMRASTLLSFSRGTTKLVQGEATNALRIFGEFRTKRTVRMRGSVADSFEGSCLSAAVVSACACNCCCCC